MDPGQLDRAFARLMVEHLGPGAEPTAALLQDFLGITNEFGLVMPTSVTGMLRALATMQGSLEVLSPGYPIIDAAQNVAKAEMLSSLKPENLADELKREVISLAPMLHRAPHHLDRIAGQVKQGKPAFRVRMFSDEDDIRVISRLINRAVLAFIGATLGVVSAMLLQIPNDQLITDNVGLFAGSILVMSVALDVLRERWAHQSGVSRNGRIRAVAPARPSLRQTHHPPARDTKGFGWRPRQESNLRHPV